MTENGSGRHLELTVNGHTHVVPDRGDTLLDVLRYDLGLMSVKDGCSPQGQCGCCTVLVDGQPRVACVTPARRVRRREITTVEGLSAGRADLWGAALCASGGSQCGFCTPGIVLRLEASTDKVVAEPDRDAVKAVADQALLAHMCRCTGWQTITDAFEAVVGEQDVTVPEQSADRARRILLEGGTAQEMTPASALGVGGFAADTPPAGHLVALIDADGAWVVGETISEARALSGKVQGRRTTIDHHYPVAMPEGEDFVAGFQTTWTDPAYLETDASWCAPGGEPRSALGNGGAFGGKTGGEIEAAAKALCEVHGRPVLALFSREDVMRRAPKRPPFGGGVREDGSGRVRFAASEGIEELVATYAPEFELETVTVAGPPTGLGHRAAGWAELAILRSAVTDPQGPIRVESPNGAVATADTIDGGLRITVSAGPVLNSDSFTSYCIGAAHMGWSWATSEAMTVDEAGEIHDLTVRSLGILRAVDTPAITVELIDDPSTAARNGSDAVFAAAAALAWRRHAFGRRWPLGTQAL